MTVIVDTNILFSSLRSKYSKYRKILLSPDYNFYSPNFLIVEIFKHKEKILEKANSPEDEVYEFLNNVLKRIQFVNEEIITKESAKKGYELCKDIDEKDTPFVALTIELNGKLWTDDKELRKGLEKKGFNQFFKLQRETKK